MAKEDARIREIKFSDGTLKKQMFIDGLWKDLYVQENAVTPLCWSKVEWMMETYRMPYKEAEQKFGHLPQFPKL